MIGGLLPDKKTAFAALQHSQKAEFIYFFLRGQEQAFNP